MNILTIALRFYQEKRYGVLSSFMTFASTAGIAVGVMALIIGLSAMNGFEAELKNKIFNLLPSASIKSVNEQFKDPAYTKDILLQSDKVEAVALTLEGSALLKDKLSFAPLLLMGAHYDEIKKVVAFEQFLHGSIEKYKYSSKGIILGKSNMQKFGLKIGDEVEILLASFDGKHYQSPQKFDFTLLGYVDLGSSLDSNFALIHYEKAQEIFHKERANTIEIKTKDFLTAYQDVYHISHNFKEGGYLQASLQTNGKLYHDIMMIRQILYIALFLVMAVASFNIISKLIMSIKEREGEIAILKTMGLQKSKIAIILILQGLLLSFRGITIGTILGLVIALNLDHITIILEQYFNIVLLNKEVYFIDYIPCQVVFSDIVAIVIVALGMSVLASIYPAIKASRVNIIEALN